MEVGMFNTTRWVVVVTGPDKPKKPFVVGQHYLRNDLAFSDMASASEIAVEDYNNRICEYPSNTFCGVIAYAEYLAQNISSAYDGPKVDPGAFVWFDVECGFVPSYKARIARDNG